MVYAVISHHLHCFPLTKARAGASARSARASASAPARSAGSAGAPWQAWHVVSSGEFMGDSENWGTIYGWLVVTGPDWNMNFIFPYIGNVIIVIIPIDEL